MPPAAKAELIRRSLRHGSLDFARDKFRRALTKDPNRLLMRWLLQENSLHTLLPELTLRHSLDKLCARSERQQLR